MNDSSVGLFQTSVNEAVQASLAQNRPLFVFLSKGDAESQHFVDSWFKSNGILDQQVQDVIAKYVLLKLTENTAEFQLFEQIFPNLILPSFYVVSQGKLVDLYRGPGSPAEFLRRSSSFDQQNTQPPPQPQQPPPLQPQAQQVPQQPQQVSQQPQSHQETYQQPQSQLPQSDIDQQERIRKHRQQVNAMRAQQEQEKQRLRDLLKADRREREAQHREEIARLKNEPTPEATGPKPPKSSPTICSLSIKLFDGSTLRCDFKPSQTLNDVRTWLDTESNVEIIPKTNAMPAFATSPYPQPTHYVFHSPSVPRITYCDEDEFKTLSELQLCPRSALILKPIYDDSGYSKSYPAGAAANGGLRNAVSGALVRLGSALYSFFDYGVADHPQYHQMEDDELADDQEPAARSTGNSQRQDDVHSQRVPLSRSDTPSMPFEDRSIISVDESSVYRNRASTTAVPPAPVQPEVERPSSVANTRSSTPLSFNRPTTLARVHTFTNDEKDEENSYNGNSVGMSKKDED